jgi:hypothetical protein
VTVPRHDGGVMPTAATAAYAPARPRRLSLRRLFRRQAMQSGAAEMWRLQQRLGTVRRTNDQWHSILREMEEHGQSTSEAYESYSLAFLESEARARQLELQVFNLRQRMATKPDMRRRH